MEVNGLERTVQPLEPSVYAMLERMSFRLHGVEEIKPTSEEWYFRVRFLASHMLLVMTDGQGWLTLDGRYIELRKGGIYACLPGQLVEARIELLELHGEASSYCLFYDVLEQQADSEVWETVRHNSRFPVAGEAALLSPLSIGMLCESLHRAWSEEHPLSRWRAQIMLQELLLSMLEGRRHGEVDDVEALLEQIRHYIERHCKQKLTIEGLAQQAGLSARHFMRLFKRRYGCSVMEYVSVHRIKQAQRLMRADRSARLRDIAAQVGYQDEMYFRRKFKQISGIPPASYMRNCRQRIAAGHPLAIGILLALQMVPCAAPADHPWTEYYRRKYETDQVLPLEAGLEVRLQQLREAAPDVILVMDGLVSAKEQERLSELAPVCAVPWSGADWRTQLIFAAQYLERSGAAEAWLQRYERKAAFVREQIRLQLRGERLCLLSIRGSQLELVGSDSIGTVFYDDLGIAPASTEGLRPRSRVLTLEQLGGLDASRLLLIIGQDQPSQTTWHRIASSERWRELLPVQQGKVELLSHSPLVEYSAFVHDLLLDEALKLWRDRP